MTTQKATIQDIQELLNELKLVPQFEKYIVDRKLSLIDSRLKIVDLMLVSGLVK